MTVSQAPSKHPITTARGVATRARIVDAACRLVSEHGVAETRLDDVMAASGTSKSQIYHYFSDREDLMTAVVESQTSAVLDFQASNLLKVRSFDDLRAWRDKIVDLTQSGGCIGGCPMGSLASELADRSETGRRALAAGFALWQMHLASALRTIQSQGDLDPDVDIDGLATGVICALQGGLLMAQTMRSTRPLELALDMALDHLSCLGKQSAGADNMAARKRAPTAAVTTKPPASANRKRDRR